MLDYPELAARTRRFRNGEPRALTVATDSTRVVYLRSTGPDDPVDRLWVLDLASGATRLVGDAAPDRGDRTAAELALRERQRLTADGITGYATDPRCRVAAYVANGRLYRADLRTGEVAEIPTAGPAVDPRPDPTGTRLAYVTDDGAGTRALRVVDGDGRDTLLAGERGTSWGLAEFAAAEEFGRDRGYWWSPDGTQVLAARVDESRVGRWYLHDPADPGAPPRSLAYPAAGTATAAVSLHLLDLDGGWVDVHWDRDAYPYLVAASWTSAGPLVAVLRRLQQHGLVLAVDPRTGETQVHAELADHHWVDVLPGTPARLSDGRVLLAGDLVRDGLDARCLFADGALLTPPSLYPRRVCGELGDDLLVEASEGEPSERHLYRVSLAPGTPPRRLTPEPGWHTGECGGDAYVVAAESLDMPGTRWQVVAPAGTYELPGRGADLPYAARPALARVTDRRLPAAVLYPRDHVAGRRLPVVVDAYGGPGGQTVVAARSRWQERQWWADRGFAVVSVDGRGTPGVSPAYEKVVHHRLADVVLADQVEGLAALTGKHPDLDTGRVAIRGWSFGGWLAALAVLRRPDVFQVAVAGAPCVDWALYDAVYAERYLGLPDTHPEVYARHSLLPDAADLRRPLLLAHGMLDDNVVPAHTMRLSAALLAARRPHAVLPLTGASHQGAAGARERLLDIELDFVRRHLPR